ncbi:MAG TPA: NnrS family protein [Candidatus Binatia bacterium]
MSVRETEASFAAPQAPRLRAEPYRLFFPLGVLLGWAGVGHWVLYATGATSSYSCHRHGLLQTQAFLMAFALGFLWTALPRRLAAPAASAREISLAVAALLGTCATLLADQWVLAELGYLALFVLLLQFGARRFLTGAVRRSPPAAFVLLAVGAAQGIAGALLILARLVLESAPWTMALGALLIEQGVFLSFVVGVGALILPLMAGEAPPPDLGSSPRETWKAVGFLALGLVIVASLVAEQAGWVRSGQIVRGLAVALGLGVAGGAWRAPGKPGLHRRLVWLAAWLAPAGLILAGLFPDYRVPALHVLFIGGFSLMAFGVATHVCLSHLGMTDDVVGRPPAVIALGAGILLALAARVAADWSDSYFTHLAWAAGVWIAASAVWLAYLGPRLVRD